MMMLNALLSEGSIIDLDGSFFIQFALFWLVYFILRKWLFGPLLAVFDAREEAIEGAKREARQVEQEALVRAKEFDAELSRVRQAANAEREKLRADAKHLEQTLLSNVREETEKRLASAQVTLTTTAAQVRSEMEKQTPVLARIIASKLLAREVQ